MAHGHQVSRFGDRLRRGGGPVRPGRPVRGGDGPGRRTGAPATAGISTRDVTEEMEVLSAQGTHHRTPDVVCFVNGLPLVVLYLGGFFDQH